MKRYAEMTAPQRWVLEYLRRHRTQPTVHVLGNAVSDRDSSYGYGLGYDRTYSALKGLERRGLVRRLPGRRPARWEAVDAENRAEATR